MITAQQVITIAAAVAALAELGAGAGTGEGDAVDGDAPGAMAVELLGADAGAGAAVGRAGTVSTTPMEEPVPLIGPDRPRGKKPPAPFWLPSTTMLMTCAHAHSCCQSLRPSRHVRAACLQRQYQTLHVKNAGLHRNVLYGSDASTGDPATAGRSHAYYGRRDTACGTQFLTAAGMCCRTQS